MHTVRRCKYVDSSGSGCVRGCHGKSMVIFGHLGLRNLKGSLRVLGEDYTPAVIKNFKARSILAHCQIHTLRLLIYIRCRRIKVLFGRVHSQIVARFQGGYRPNHCDFQRIGNNAVHFSLNGCLSSLDACHDSILVHRQDFRIVRGPGQILFCGVLRFKCRRKLHGLAFIYSILTGNRNRLHWNFYPCIIVKGCNLILGQRLCIEGDIVYQGSCAFPVGGETGSQTNVRQSRIFYQPAGSGQVSDHLLISFGSGVNRVADLLSIAVKCNALFCYRHSYHFPDFLAQTQVFYIEICIVCILVCGIPKGHGLIQCKSSCPSPGCRGHFKVDQTAISPCCSRGLCPETQGQAIFHGDSGKGVGGKQRIAAVAVVCLI